MVPIMFAWCLAVILFALWGLAIVWPTDDEAGMWRWRREQDAWRDTFK